MKTPQQLHIPVLLDDVLRVLAPQIGETYLDLTAGYGGHAQAIIAKIGNARLATLVDRDKNAIEALDGLESKGAQVMHKSYAEAATELVQAGKTFDMILLDIGVSSPQLDSAERGFSFMREGPLDMRMDQTTGQSAAELLARTNKEALAKILRDYGEEPHDSEVAQAIIRSRPIRTTTELAAVVEAAYKGRRGKIHPATRTFQALRIAVNDELKQLESTLSLLPQLLTPGGRVAIISFHSLEDRLVKRFLQEQSSSGYEATLQLLTRQPVAGAHYDVINPRARSAKLRAAAKINTKRGYHAIQGKGNRHDSHLQSES